MWKLSDRMRQCLIVGKRDLCVFVGGGTGFFLKSLKKKTTTTTTMHGLLKTSILAIAPVSYDSPPALPSGKGSVSL